MKKRNSTYGLIGKSLGHSFSKTYFTDKFESLSSEETYQNFELQSIDELPRIIQDNDSLKGLNVTIPYKEEIIPFLHALSEEAEKIRAVNTIQVLPGQKLIGYNTDAFGFHQSIKPFLRGDCHRALILGTGGASKAVHYVLNGLGIDCFFISRNPEKENEFGYEEMNDIMMSSVGLIVNTTPIGTYPNSEDCPNIPYELLTEKHHVYDLIYNPKKTEFLKRAEEQEASIQNGYQMLVHQAEKAYEIWNLV